MGVVVSCPVCRQSREYKKGNLGRCIACGAELPHTVRDGAARLLRRRRPILITIFAVFFSFFAGVGALIELTALLGSGPYTINGEPASKQEFLRFALPMVLPMIAAGILAYALWRERSWGRPLFVGFYVLVGILSAWLPHHVGVEPSGAAATAPEGGGVWAGLLMIGIVVGLFGWYFYKKPNVVAYYGELKAEKG